MSLRLSSILFKKRTQASDLHRDWDDLRDGALTPAERSEIDAIFARYA